jgi:hypothetical protein
MPMAAIFHAAGAQAQLVADGYQCFLDAADVLHHVYRVRQLDDGIADQLSGAVPGDLAASVDVHHRGAVVRALLRVRALAGRVHRRVFQQQQRVRAGVVGSGHRQFAL